MEINQEIQKEKCGNCGKNDCQELHECPYQSDVNNDKEFKCNCCEIVNKIVVMKYKYGQIS